MERKNPNRSDRQPEDQHATTNNQNAKATYDERKSNVWIPLGYHRDLTGPYKDAINSINEDPTLAKWWAQACEGKANTLPRPQLRIAYSTSMPNQMSYFKALRKPQGTHRLKKEETDDKKHSVKIKEVRNTQNSAQNSTGSYSVKFK